MLKLQSYLTVQIKQVRFKKTRGWVYSFIVLVWTALKLPVFVVWFHKKAHNVPLGFTWWFKIGCKSEIEIQSEVGYRADTINKAHLISSFSSMSNYSLYRHFLFPSNRP